MRKIILVVGLPGSGKTTLADLIANKGGYSRVNADQVRASISKDLKFTEVDREVQAWRMGRLSALALQKPPFETGTKVFNQVVVSDFVCPTHRAMEHFENGAAQGGVGSDTYIVWMDTITPNESRFMDTAKVFMSPKTWDLCVCGWKDQKSLAEIANEIIQNINQPIGN